MKEWDLVRPPAPFGNFSHFYFFFSEDVPKLNSLQGDKLYNAYEKDIAIVNIFFGESTVFGESIGISSSYPAQEKPRLSACHEIGLLYNGCIIFWCSDEIFCRVWKISKDDLVWLHLQLRRFLRPLPWNQLRVSHWARLLVLCQTLQELCNEELRIHSQVVLHNSAIRIK